MLKIFILVLAFLPMVLSYSASGQTLNDAGTHFVVEIDAYEAKGTDVIESAIRVLEARLKGLGAKGEVSRSSDRHDRIEVKVYGHHDSEKLHGLFRNRQLEIRAVVSPPNPNPYKSFSTFVEAQNDVVGGQEVHSYAERNGEFQCFVILEGRSIINGKDVRKAEAFSRTGRESDYQVSFSLSKKGSANLSEWTGKNINKYLAVLLDEKIVNIAYIKSQISDEGEISGRFSKLEAYEIASNLQSGALPETLRIITERKFEKK